MKAEKKNPYLLVLVVVTKKEEHKNRPSKITTSQALTKVSPAAPERLAASLVQWAIRIWPIVG